MIARGELHASVPKGCDHDPAIWERDYDVASQHFSDRKVSGADPFDLIGPTCDDRLGQGTGVKSMPPVIQYSKNGSRVIAQSGHIVTATAGGLEC